MAKERSGKYERKVKINTSFEGALNILMGKNRPDQPILIGQGEFEFEKDDLYEQLAYNEKLLFIHNNYRIKITPTKLSDIVIKVEIISDVTYETVETYAVFATYKDKVEFNNMDSVLATFTTNPYKKDIEKEKYISFEDKDYLVNEILLFCQPNSENISIKASVFTSS